MPTDHLTKTERDFVTKLDAQAKRIRILEEALEGIIEDPSALSNDDIKDIAVTALRRSRSRHDS